MKLIIIVNSLMVVLKTLYYKVIDLPSNILHIDLSSSFYTSKIELYTLSRTLGSIDLGYTLSPRIVCNYLLLLSKLILDSFTSISIYIQTTSQFTSRHYICHQSFNIYLTSCITNGCIIDHQQLSII